MPLMRRMYVHYRNKSGLDAFMFLNKVRLTIASVLLETLD